MFLGLLWTGTFVEWFANLTNFKIIPSAWTDCKLYYFLWAYCGHYSSAILTIMSAEKFVALYFPLQAKRICNIKIAKWVSFVTACTFIIVEFYLLIVMKAGTNKFGFKECTATPFSLTMVYYLDFVFYSLGPFFIMCIFNSAIIYKLIMIKCKDRFKDNHSVNQSLSKSAMKGATMLVAVSLTFVILTLPVCLVYTGVISSTNVSLTVSLMMSTLNHSVNGFLYCIFGSRFRKELLRLVCRCRQNKVTSEINSVTNTVSPM